MTVSKTVHNLKLDLTPEQVKQLRPLLDTNGSLKTIYVGSSLDKESLVLSYIACNAGPGALLTATQKK
jgi:hypothetical protein